ncbi:hypothetical protein [Microbulbifer agarilyticus]|uniref:hypothetical protein n=1 Tax=Microbulbifer agarilyticus TaxID=260552 RepID=UPI001CD4FEDC|nr:hypothetical protein [Microbulbifer agarilyticus]MCA0892258.1 hypothetical protein [Microbulbifer agarilyticus]
MKQLFLIILLLPITALADTSSQFDTQFGLGLGTQYGGVAGLKYSIRGNSNSFYIGAGRADFFKSDDERYGLTLGWEKSLSEHHAIGVAVRTRTDPLDGAYIATTIDGQPAYMEAKGRYESFLAGTYTYHFKPSSEPGFLTGVSIGKTYSASNYRNEFLSGLDYGMHFGYQF